MAYLDIDFIIPAAIMASAIIGVLMIRKAVRQGAERARRRTAELIAELDNGPEAAAPAQNSEPTDPAA